MDQYRNAIRLIMTQHDLEERVIVQAAWGSEMSSIYRTSSLNGTNKIIALKRYHRYWSDQDKKIKNPLFGEFERRILDLKEMDAKAIRSFSEELDPWLGKGFSICVVPSSDLEVKCNGIGAVGRMLARNGRIDRIGYLIRHSRIEKLAVGGDRRKCIHYNSIRVSQNISIKGEDILLLDDITTTGNSLLACRDLLLANGARSVEMLALGRTGEGGINLLEGQERGKVGYEYSTIMSTSIM